jgi:hypothetical protein
MSLDRQIIFAWTPQKYPLYSFVSQIYSEQTCPYSAKAVRIFLNIADLVEVLFSIDILDFFQL